MGTALRWPCTMASDPKMIRVGFLGGVVYRAVLEAMKAQGWDGRAGAADLTGSYLARHLNCGPEDPTPTTLQEALGRCVKAGLLEREGPWLVVPGWDALDSNACSNQCAPVKGYIYPSEDRDSKDSKDSKDFTEPLTLKTMGYLSPVVAQELAGNSVNLRSRPGNWWEWEKAVMGLLATGVGMEAVVAWLKRPENQAEYPSGMLKAVKKSAGAQAFSDAAREARERRLAVLREDIRVVRSHGRLEAWLASLPPDRQEEARRVAEGA